MLRNCSHKTHTWEHVHIYASSSSLIKTTKTIFWRWYVTRGYHVYITDMIDRIGDKHSYWLQIVRANFNQNERTIRLQTLWPTSSQVPVSRGIALAVHVWVTCLNRFCKETIDKDELISFGMMSAVQWAKPELVYNTANLITATSKGVGTLTIHCLVHLTNWFTWFTYV